MILKSYNFPFNMLFQFVEQYENTEIVCVVILFLQNSEQSEMG